MPISIGRKYAFHHGCDGVFRGTAIGAARRVAAGVAVLVALLALGACKTTIPATDSMPPRVELRLTGPGGGTMPNPPKGIWIGDPRIGVDATPGRMVIGWSYDFTLTVTDQGGVSSARLEVDNEIVEISSIEGTGAVSDEVDGTTRVIEVRGAPDDPRTALVLTGDLRVPSRDGGTFEEITTRLRAYGLDFGGDSGHPNETDLIVEAPFRTGLRQVLNPLKTGAERVRVGHGPDAPDAFCPIRRYGLASQYWNRDYGIPVGYDHFWDNGPRRRCESGLSDTFLGLVKFDLSGLPDRPLGHAFLHFTEVDVNTNGDRDNTEFCLQQEDGEVVERRATGDVTSLVGPATEEWPAGKHSVSDEGHMPVTRGVPVTDRGPDKRVDITDIVQDWLDGRLPNHGLALLGRDYNTYRKNKVCAGTATSFKLELIYEVSG